MTGDDDDKKDGKSLHGERLLEALRYELAKQELLEDEPTPEELRDTEPAARYWQARASERLAPTTPECSREELLARVQEVGEIARALGLAYLADARYAEGLAVEELHAHVIALEAAVATKSSTER